jgi:type I restriction enzyme S subunit
MKERVPIPPLHVQKQITALVHLESRLQKAVTGLVALLREYRTRLIADVVTGKLDVREVAANLPEEAEEPEALDEIEVVENGEEMMDEGDGTSNLQEAEA